MSADRLPPGYARVDAAGAELVARAELADALRDAVRAHGSLYGWAQAHPARRELRGRAIAWAVPLPGGGGDVVVRHSWHGGLLAPLTRDLFLPPTRAPRELDASARLRAAGIRTPEVAAYALYPAPLGTRRADVVTRLVPDGADLALVLRGLPVAREPLGPWVRATGALLHALARAGVRHPDLNVKNVLLAPDGGAASGTLAAWVLDLDVAQLPDGAPTPGRVNAAGEANLQRLERSLDKWRRERGLPVLEEEIVCLRALARHGPDARIELVWRPGYNVGPT